MQENIQQSTRKPYMKLKWVVILLTIGLSGMVVLLISSQKKHAETSNTISDTPQVSIPTSTIFSTKPVIQEVVGDQTITIDTAPTFTGVAESSEETTLPRADDQAIQLRQLLPLETDQVTVTYDYENDQFIFKLKANDNKFDSRSWLDERNFSDIPLDQVRIE